MKQAKFFVVVPFVIFLAIIVVFAVSLLTQDDQSEREIIVEDPDIVLETPDDILEELSVSDIEVRVESIASQPDLWRAFLDSPAPISDPTWDFGCYEFLDTGAVLTLDVWSGEDGVQWVSEAVGDVLIGVGRSSIGMSEEIATNKQYDMESACLAATRRDYYDYFFLADDLQLEGEFEDYRLLTNNVPMPITQNLEYQIYDTPQAVLIGHTVVYIGYEGIEAYDFDLGDQLFLYNINWNDAWGVSDLYVDDSGEVLAFATQAWDEEQANIFVYTDLADGNAYSQHYRIGEMAWELGVNGTARLQFPDDLEFLDSETLFIIETPEFDQKIVDGDFPPDTGPRNVTTWKFLE